MELIIAKVFSNKNKKGKKKIPKKLNLTQSDHTRRFTISRLFHKTPTCTQ